MDPVRLWRANWTFPNLPFPKTLPSLNSSAKVELFLTFDKILGLFGCSWEDMFLLAGVKTLLYLWSIFWFFFSELTVKKAWFERNILVWLWEFLDVLTSFFFGSKYNCLKPVGDLMGYTSGTSYFSLKICLSKYKSFMLRLCFIFWDINKNL